MYPECIIKLNELTLTEENKYYTISLVYGIWEKQTSKVNETRWGGQERHMGEVVKMGECDQKE